MATTTKLYAIGGSYGNSGNGSYTNSAASSVYIGPYSGLQYRTRLTFPSLRAALGLGTSAIKISGVTLALRRAEGSTTVTAGCSTSSAWGATRYGSASGTIGSTTKYYYIAINGTGDYIDDYTGNWHIHLTGSGSRARCLGYGSDYPPVIMITWEYVANTIKTEVSESVIGEPVTFNITPGASDASYTLTYSFAGETGTIVEKTTDTSIAWTPSLELATGLPNSTEGTATITMTVYNASGSVIRTELLYLTLTVPETLLPVIPDNGVVIELFKALSGYALTGETYANLTPTVDMNGTYGSTVKSITVTVTNGENVQTISWPSVSEVDAGVFVGDPLPTNIFTTEGSVITSIEVVDSRGRVVTAQGPSITVLAYTRPVISLFAIDRYEPVYDDNEEISGYAISDIGENVWVNIQANATDLSPDGTQLNSIYWSIVTTEGGVVTTDDSYSGVGEGVVVNIVNDRSLIEDVVSAADTKNYTLTVIDAVGNVAYAYDAIVPGRANFALAASKYGAAFGGIPKGTEENPMLESYYPIHAYEPIHAHAGVDGVGVLVGATISSQSDLASSAFRYSPTVTIPRDGLYLIIAYGNFQGTSNTTGGWRMVFIQRNGSDIASTHYPHTQSGWPTYYLPEIAPFKAGDVIRSGIQQTSGSTRTCVAGIKIVQLSNTI